MSWLRGTATLRTRWPLDTGFLKCASCGAKLVIVTGRTNAAHPNMDVRSTSTVVSAATV